MLKTAKEFWMIFYQAKTVAGTKKKKNALGKKFSKNSLSQDTETSWKSKLEKPPRYANVNQTTKSPVLWMRLKEKNDLKLQKQH